VQRSEKRGAETLPKGELGNLTSRGTFSGSRGGKDLKTGRKNPLGEKWRTLGREEG